MPSKPSNQAQPSSSSSSSSSSKSKPQNIFSNDGSFLERFRSIKQSSGSSSSDNTIIGNKSGSSSPSPLTANRDSNSPAQDDPKLAALKRKKALEERIRNRGKRRLQKAGSEGSEDEGQDEVEHDGNGSKRAKKSKEGEDEVDAYLKEVRKHERSTLKDSGSGVRALVK